MVVLGFAVVAIVVPVVSMVVGLADARARASITAHDVAVAVARHGTHPPVDADVDVEVTVARDEITVVARIEVPIVSALGTRLAVAVAERAVMVTSPYRSGR